MKKSTIKIAAGLSAVVLIALALHFLSSPEPPRAADSAGLQPELIRVTQTEAAIAWRTENATEGVVTYAPVDDPEQSKRVSEATGVGNWHEVSIKGLTPGTRYSYSIADSGPAFEYLTQPKASTPFSFLFVWGKPGDEITEAAMSELPEFVFSMTPLVGDEVGKLSSLRPNMPVYDLHGISSPYLKAMDEAVTSATRGPGWALDWGGLQLILSGDVNGIRAKLDNSRAQTMGVVWASYKGRDWSADGNIDSAKIRVSALHNALVAHNRTNRDRPAAFVFFLAPKLCKAEIDGVNYVGIPAEASGNGVARIDFSVESVRMSVLGGDGEMMLRKPPLSQKRTCVECRRLADKGAYEESIKAYVAFIQANPSHFQIDDAYFAVAEILDEKLFRFKDATLWYERLIRKYPKSTLAPAAQLRLSFLTAHTDFDYKPLAVFERIRRVDYAGARGIPKKREYVLARVEDCIKKYPDCSIAVQMRYWLANQLRTFDVDRALNAYRELIARNPDSAEARNAWLEMGEACYDNARYAEALDIYDKALAAVPERSDAIRSQVFRSKRNLRRRYLAVAAYGVLALCLLPSIAFAWPGCRKRRFVVAAIVGGLLFALFYAGAWLLHEQFESTRMATALCFGFALSAVAGYPILASLRSRIAGVKGRVLACLLNLAALLAGCYLTIYHLNEHYLIILKL